MGNSLEPPDWNCRDIDKMLSGDVLLLTPETTSSATIAIKKIFFIFISVLSAQTLAACSLDAAIQSLEGKIAPAVLQNKASNNELVPVSQQGVVTAQGYTVQSSFSFQAGRPEVVTSKGYKVYTNVQSTLFRE